MRHSAYKKEKYAFINANIKVINTILKTLSWVQTDATTPECVLAVMCKRMQQLPEMLGPAVHRGKDTTHKSL